MLGTYMTLEKGMGVMRKLLKVALAVVMAVTMGAALVACGVSEEIKAAAGNYKISKVSSQGKTFSISEFTELSKDTSFQTLYIELKEDGKFSMNDPAGEVLEGTFEVKGSEITLKGSLLDGGMTASLANGEITIEQAGTTLVYAK